MTSQEINDGGINEMKTLTVLLSLFYVSSALGEDFKLINPRVLKIQDNVERTILDYSVADDLGMNQMLAPVGWTEPIVALGYELRGIVISGTLGLEFHSETVVFQVDQGFVIPSDTKVRIHNAGNTPLHLVEVLRPGHKDSLVTVFERFD